MYTSVPIEDINQGSVEVDSGVNEKEVYFVPAANVTGVPALPDITDASALDTLAKLTGDVTLSAGKFWHKIDVLVDTSEVKNESVGPKGQRRWKSGFDLLIGGTDAQKLGFSRMVLNTPGYWLVEQRNGQKILIGSTKGPAYISEGSLTWGKTNEDTVGGSYTVEANAMAVIYEGTVTTE